MRATIILTALLVLAISIPAYAAKVELNRQYPMVGENETVKLSGIADLSSATLMVIYRPNSATEVKVDKGSFSETGEISWVPENPGITTLLVNGSDGKKLTSLNVATRFKSAPATGLMVMFFAGLLLFGGAGYSLRQALKS